MLGELGHAQAVEGRATLYIPQFLVGSWEAMIAEGYLSCVSIQLQQAVFRYALPSEWVKGQSDSCKWQLKLSQLLFIANSVRLLPKSAPRSESSTVHHVSCVAGPVGPTVNEDDLPQEAGAGAGALRNPGLLHPLAPSYLPVNGSRDGFIKAVSLPNKPGR